MRLNTPTQVRRAARVEVRYVSGRMKGRAVVRLGRLVKMKAARR